MEGGRVRISIWSMAAICGPPPWTTTTLMPSCGRGREGEREGGREGGTHE